MSYFPIGARQGVLKVTGHGAKRSDRKESAPSLGGAEGSFSDRYNPILFRHGSDISFGPVDMI